MSYREQLVKRIAMFEALPTGKKVASDYQREDELKLQLKAFDEDQTIKDALDYKEQTLFRVQAKDFRMVAEQQGYTPEFIAFAMPKFVNVNWAEEVMANLEAQEPNFEGQVKV